MNETIELPKSVLVKSQVKKIGKDIPLDEFGYEGETGRLIVEVRYDDECGNGHNSFAITGEVIRPKSRSRDKMITGGCIHEVIAKHCPELAPYIKWHLFDSEGPMHYISNTVYLAGDRDCYGKSKGEATSFKEVVKVEGIPDGVDIQISVKEFKWFLESRDNNADITIHRIEHGPTKDGYKFGPKFSFRICKWHECGFDSEEEAKGCLELFKSGKCDLLVTASSYSEGKERQLDAARSIAMWPDATDDELMQEPEALKLTLLARLPALIAEFKAAIESLGFVY
jgi:hypothetical protein